jgi:branched-chain amino acid transport system ATP-binding protein
MTVTLRVTDLAVAYGHIEAVKGISLELQAGEITALVGANGAGKSTTLLALSGLLKPLRGKFEFEGEDISRLAPNQIVQRGVVQVPEGRAILTTLSVLENLQLGAYSRKDKAGINQSLDEVYHLLPRLKDRAAQFAGNLSGGEQQMLAIGRALMAKPKLLLLDEPSMGLAPIMVQEIFRTLVTINKGGLSVLLVEQNVRQALKIARHGFVIETGKIVLADTGANLLADPKVEAAYLGG